MRDFHFACPTEIFFGNNCIMNNPEVFLRLGKRAYIVTTQFPDGIRNTALDDIRAVLELNGISYVVDEDAQPDPPVNSIVGVRDRALKFGPDYLISVGGGSAMDTVKAVNVLLKHKDESPCQALFGDGPHVFGVGAPHEGVLPIISVPTTAGTGSDLTGVAVVTRNDIQSKSGTNNRSYANYAFVDPRYIASAPTELNQCTALDALCHGIEIYLSRKSRNDFMTNMFAETAFRQFAIFKDHLLHGTMTEEDYELQTLHSVLQGIVIVNELTGVPHGMGYPLSYYYHIHHGLACVAFEGEYLRTIKDDPKVQKILELLKFRNIDEFCNYVQHFIDKYIDIKITESQIKAWTKTFCETKWRVERHPDELREEVVEQIYRKALKKFIVTQS